MKRYEPPPVESDEPLDPIERSWGRLIVARVVRRIREEEAAARAAGTPVPHARDDDKRSA